MAVPERFQYHAWPVTQSSTAPKSNGAIVRQTARALQQLEAKTILRAAAVQAEGIVQKQKLRELDGLGRSAMTGQTMLVTWAGTLAASNAVLFEKLTFFADIIAVGKAEVIADTIDKFGRESFRS
jgi:uncharacterized phosphosugar-binding protein